MTGISWKYHMKIRKTYYSIDLFKIILQSGDHGHRYHSESSRPLFYHLLMFLFDYAEAFKKAGN